MRSELRRQQERIRQRRKRARRRDWVTTLKVRQGCKDCSETHPAVLQFHHVNPSTKLIRVSHTIATNLPRRLIEAEIAKCIVLCANCHAKRHWNEQQDLERLDIRPSR